MFLCFSDHCVLLTERLMSMWLDRETGAKCYMLSARELNIAWGDSLCYWHWIPITGSRFGISLLSQVAHWIPITGSSFSEAAELLNVCWLEIRGKIEGKMLSQSSTYAAYIVLKVARRAYGLDVPHQKTSVSLGGSKSTRHVCLDGYDSDSEVRASELHHPMSPWMVLRPSRRSHPEIPQNVLLPQDRADGWKELELGEFYNTEGEDSEVCTA